MCLYGENILRNAHIEFLAVQWLACPTFTAEGSDQSLVGVIKIVQIVGCGKKKSERN